VPQRQPGPVGLSDDATLLEHIKKAIAESRFTDEGYRKIRARLRLFRHPQLARAGAAADGRAWAAGTHRVRKRPDKGKRRPAAAVILA
jgi:hypothetical protein